MGMRLKLTNKDLGLARLLRELPKSLADAHAKAGFLSDADGGRGERPEMDPDTKKDTGINLATLAAVHEFGTETLPERPFLRASFEQHRDKYVAIVREGLLAVIDQRTTPGKVFRELGQQMAWDIKAFVLSDAGVQPPTGAAQTARKLARGAWRIAKYERKTRKALAAGQHLPVARMPGDPRTLVDSGQLVGGVTGIGVAK